MSIARATRGLGLIFLLAWVGGNAQPLATPAPLSPEGTGVAAGRWVLLETRATQALQAGFPVTAALAYRELLADPNLPEALRPRLVLALVTSLIDAAQVAEAEATLQTYSGPKDSSYQLRAGLLAAHARRWPQVRAALEAGRIEELPPAERGWWLFLQAQLADGDQDLTRAAALYQQAAATAVSEQARARFILSQEQALLRSGQASEARLANLRRNMENTQGTTPGYIFARSYAAALFEMRRTAEAQEVLQRQLDTVPPSQRDTADQLRLMLGLVAGETSDTGRRAFQQLVERGQQPEIQRVALQLLTRGAREPADQRRLRGELTRWLEGSHPIAGDLLLARALLNLRLAEVEPPDRQAAAYRDAEEDARTLLDQYPGSALQPAALGIRLSVAWEQRRYRAVADLVAQLRALLPAGRERAELGVLLAEAFFRARDFPNAAAAYEAAAREPLEVAPFGMLVFQRSLAEIQSGRPEAAARLLDEASGNPAFDASSRWQAEWNLVKELQVRGEAAAALDRVERLLQEGAEPVDPELRIRLLWLQADLSFDLERHEAALGLADALLAALPAGGLDASTREKVAANTLLLKFQTLLALGRDAEGTAALEQLRVQHRGTPASAYSFIVQANRLALQGKLADAQSVLTDLADSIESLLKDGNRADAEELRGFATLALYEAALNAERRGLDQYLREAHNLLERIKTDYPRDDLRFYAMLKQGDLLRQLNEFATARQAYEEILISYAQHPDALLAQLALADTLFALGANSVVNYESAAALFERLRDLPTAPVDLRAEAGFKWGYALARRGATDRAVPVLWSVVSSFLLDAGQAEALGGKGRYWVSRTLLELGQLHEDAGRLDEAQKAYGLIIERNLGGATQAQSKLNRYRAGSSGARP